MWQFASLSGKIAVVTGASRGIGQAIAYRLGQMGAFVIGTATTEQGAHAITQWFEQNGIAGEGLVLNVTDKASIEACVKHLAQKGKVSILVNNAALTRDNLLMRMKEEEWDATLQANLTGVFRITQALLRDMVKERWGRIIMLSSVVGYMGNAGQTNYAATKGAIAAFAKSLAREVASRGITVNVVAPGFIDTDMTRVLDDKQREAILKMIPQAQLGTPDDVAACVGFLASIEASYITGQALHVNGGMLMV